MEILLVICLMAMLNDLLNYKIDNKIIVSGYTSAIVWNYMTLDYINSLKRILVMIIVFIVLYPLFYIRSIGAGDIKLLSIMALFLNMNMLINTLLYICLATVIYILTLLLYRKSLLLLVPDLLAMLINIKNGNTAKLGAVTLSKYRILHMTIPIFAGVLAFTIKSHIF